MPTDPKEERLGKEGGAAGPYRRFRDEAESLMMNIEAKRTDPDWTPDPITLAMTAGILEEMYERGKVAAVVPEGSGPSVESAFKDRQAETSVDLEALLREVRPFVAIAPSGTSGWDFRENCERILKLIDAALARRSTGQRTPTGQLFKDGFEAGRGSLAVGRALAEMAERECENGIEAIGETCPSVGKDDETPDNCEFEYWCGPCIAKALIARGFDAASVPAPTGQQEAGARRCLCGQSGYIADGVVEHIDSEGVCHSVDACWRWPFPKPATVPAPPSAPQEGLAERFKLAMAVFEDMADPQPAMAAADAEARAHWMQGCARLALIKLRAPPPTDFWRSRYDAAVKLSYSIEADLGRLREAASSVMASLMMFVETPDEAPTPATLSGLAALLRTAATPPDLSVDAAPMVPERVQRDASTIETLFAEAAPEADMVYPDHDSTAAPAVALKEGAAPVKDWSRDPFMEAAQKLVAVSVVSFDPLRFVCPTAFEPAVRAALRALLPEEQQSQAPAAPALDRLNLETGEEYGQAAAPVPRHRGGHEGVGQLARAVQSPGGRMTPTNEPARRGPPAASEEDKARARTLLRSLPIDEGSLVYAFAAEFARIRAEATEAERERIAASFDRSARMLFEEDNRIGSQEHRAFAAAIRAAPEDNK